ncbi:hypothetical protein [uncultured Nostoc sp.]|uniref:hypothetical protein n=1 Tax=uncultured Nostoc sp. TaxID=340711 RepID=UPI0035CBE00D
MEKFNQQVSFGVAPNEFPVVKPKGNRCSLECELLMQFQLPCQCWLYRCVVDNIPIPISLIHPRWFYYGPPFVRFWKMRFDPTITQEQMIQLASLPANNLTQESQDIKFNSPEPTLVDDDTSNFGYKDWKKDGLNTFPSGDRFERGGIDLLEYTAHQSLDFHKTIQDSHRAEEYARDYSRLIRKLNKKWQEKELVRPLIPITLADPLPSSHSDPKFKKGKERRMTGCELAEKEEILKRRENRRLSIERARREKYYQLHHDDIEGKYITNTL